MLSARHPLATCSPCAITMGLLGGVLLWLATAVLLLKGGEDVGMHLGLLRCLSPGYGVTWTGAWIGLSGGSWPVRCRAWCCTGVTRRSAARRRVQPSCSSGRARRTAPPVLLLPGGALGVGLGALLRCNCSCPRTGWSCAAPPRTAPTPPSGPVPSRLLGSFHGQPDRRGRAFRGGVRAFACACGDLQRRRPGEGAMKDEARTADRTIRSTSSSWAPARRDSHRARARRERRQGHGAGTQRLRRRAVPHGP